MSEQGFTLTSPDFVHGAAIPAHCTCDGRGDAPRLQWTHAPAGTQSFALIVDDPDAPHGTFTHWVLFDIPADVRRLVGDDAVGIPGKNDFQADGYGGPCPPANHGKHRYFFRLYALDTATLGLPRAAKRQAVQDALQEHLLDQAELMGTYERIAG